MPLSHFLFTDCTIIVPHCSILVLDCSVIVLDCSIIVLDCDVFVTDCTCFLVVPQGADGVEYLIVPVDTSTLLDFLEKEEGD